MEHVRTIILPSASGLLDTVSLLLAHKSEFEEIIRAIVRAEHYFLDSTVPATRSMLRSRLMCGGWLLRSLEMTPTISQSHTDSTQRLTRLVLRPPRRL